jgi:tetratricopeptide (TPR) repeat protein
MAYRNTQKNVREIGRELGVGTVLEGSVRRAGERVRIVAQLVDARSDSQIWSEIYDRQIDDIFAIQSDVAQRIASALETELTPGERAHLARRPTRDMQAYDLYLHARHALNRRTEEGMAEAIRLLTRSIDIDAGFALAHAALADSYAILGIYGARRPDDVMPLAEASADLAIQLDADLGEAWSARACVRSVYRWDWAAAEQDFQRAIELSPQYPTAQHWYAVNYLAPRGRIAQAHAALERAADLDPLSPVIRASRAFLFHLEDRYDEAIAECRSILQRDPEFAMAWFFLGQACEAHGLYPEALDAFESASALRGENPEIISGLGRAAFFAGDHTRAESLLGSLQVRAESEYVSPVRIALLHLAMGRTEAALDWLERAIEVRAADLIWIGVHPLYRSLRQHPRLIRLLDTIGLHTPDTPASPEPHA